jgi:hypothetical protein
VRDARRRRDSLTACGGTRVPERHASALLGRARSSFVSPVHASAPVPRARSSFVSPVHASAPVFRARSSFVSPVHASAPVFPRIIVVGLDFCNDFFAFIGEPTLPCSWARWAPTSSRAASWDPRTAEVVGDGLHTAGIVRVPGIGATRGPRRLRPTNRSKQT